MYLTITIQNDDSLPRVVPDISKVTSHSAHTYLVFVDEQISIVAVVYARLQEAVIWRRILHLDVHHDGPVLRGLSPVSARHFQAAVLRNEDCTVIVCAASSGLDARDCVQREVWEETHLRVTNIRYFASQPWPYPSGLMVGFTADYLSGDLQLQKAELSDGGWFARDNLPCLPDPSSIAYRLIMDWEK